MRRKHLDVLHLPTTRPKSRLYMVCSVKLVEARERSRAGVVLLKIVEVLEKGKVVDRRVCPGP